MHVIGASCFPKKEDVMNKLVLGIMGVVVYCCGWLGERCTEDQRGAGGVHGGQHGPEGLSRL